MAGRLDGKRALITAAGQGIGRATALAFADEGAIVYATDVDPGKLTDLAGHANIAAMKLDCLDPVAISALAKELGTIDVIFNCAGFVHNGTVLDATEEQWALAFDLNVRSMFRITKAFLPAMLDKGAGSIVNVASIASSLKGVPNRFVYASTKAAVIGVTKSVAADFVGRGIRCNAVCPGTVHTPSLDERIDASPDPAQARKDFVARQPMGRLGKAEEIAKLAVYLASDESVFVTGQAYVIDGGILI